MKYISKVILTLIIATFSTSSYAQGQEAISVEGVWSRSFEMQKGSMQHVAYTITADSIVYEMSGAMPMNYVIKVDKVLTNPTRYIGKFNDNQYVIFIKNHSDKSIDLFKKAVESMDEALNATMPADDAKGQYTSWNTYFSKK